MKKHLLILALFVSGCAKMDSSELTLSSLGEPNSDEKTVTVDDMIMEKDDFDTEEGYTTQAATSFSYYQSTPWPNGVLPIVFDPSISQARKDFFFAKCATWTANAKVRCVNRTSQAVYVYVTDDYAGCNSYVGRGKTAGARRLNLASGCWNTQNVLHEIGHALGLIHEHQRADRDKYVKINLAKVIPQYRFAFNKIASIANQGAYDYRSVMHYKPTAFTVDGSVTVQALNGSVVGSMGVVTAGDSATMSRVYGAAVP